MGDFSPGNTNGSSGGCITTTCAITKESLKGTNFYKSDLNGYSARQFKTSINNIEEATLSNGSKKLFCLSDRGLYYINSEDKLNRVSVPVSINSIPIDIRNIDNNGFKTYLIDDKGSRYYLENNTYVKSIVDNNSNKAAGLNCYVSKVHYNDYYDDRNNLVKCYITSNGKYISWLYENYEGDRTWNVPVSSCEIISLSKTEGNEIFGVTKNGTLQYLNGTQKSFNNCSISADITGIIYCGELKVNNQPYLFVVTRSKVYCTSTKQSGTTKYDLNTLTELSRVFEFQNGSWVDKSGSISNILYANQNNNLLILVSRNRLYCISKDSSWINGGLSAIVNTSFNLDSNTSPKNILIDDNNILLCTERHNTRTSAATTSGTYSKKVVSKEDMFYKYKFVETTKRDARGRKYIPYQWNAVFFTDPSDHWVKNANIRKFNVTASVRDTSIPTYHELIYDIYEIVMIGNLITYKKLDFQQKVSYTQTAVTTKYVKDVPVTLNINSYDYYGNITNRTAINLAAPVSSNNFKDNYIIGYSDSLSYNNIMDNASASNTYGYVNAQFIGNTELIYEVKKEVFETKNVPYINHNDMIVEQRTDISKYELSLLQNNKVIKQKIVDSIDLTYYSGFHAFKVIDNNALLATPNGLVTLDTGLKAKESNILIDVTGDTDFREMYEITYDSGEHEGDWFIFTTSDGLFTCRAGDPADSLWQPEWHIYRYGTSFWKVRCSTYPQKDPETGKKMVSFPGSFTIKYPSYIY